MSGQAGLLELSAGSVLRLDGTDWTVAAVDACFGRVRLESGGGDERWRSIRWLAHHRECQAVPAAGGEGPAGPRRQPATLDDLTSYQREVVRLRAAHVLETETGFRGGDPLRPAPGEPRPAFDPRATTLEQRRQAKVAELKALGPEEAALLGLGQVGERTLKRMAAAMRDRGPAGCIDRRWVRPGGGHPVITEEVREAIFAARAEFLRRSKMSMRDCHVLASQYALEKFGPQVQVPSYWTLREVWLEWFGPGGTRQRYARTAAAVDPSKVHIVVHRPGQVVALDTTPLPVKVRDGMFGDPVSVISRAGPGRESRPRRWLLPGYARHPPVSATGPVPVATAAFRRFPDRGRPEMTPTRGPGHQRLPEAAYRSGPGAGAGNRAYDAFRVLRRSCPRMLPGPELRRGRSARRLRIRALRSNRARPLRPPRR